MLLLLRLQHIGDSPHLLWVAAALVAMGLVDAVHAILPFGPAWSWLRHWSTFVGGLLSAMVWLPPKDAMVRRAGLAILVLTGLILAVTLGLLWQSAWLPPPFLPHGYALSVTAVNALGGLGFVAASVFFSRRYRRKPGFEDLALASYALLFGASGLLFGFSSVWSADWWAWHCFRLLAYGFVLGTAYGTVVSLYRETARHAVDLEGRDVRRTAELEREVAARVQAEQEQRESEETLRSAFANAAIGFAVTGPDGRFVAANPAYCAISGYDLDELRTVSFPQLVHAEDRAANMRLIDQMLAGEIPSFVVENRYVRRDVQTVWVRKSVSLVRDEAGAPKWIIALVEDISGRHEAEESLRQSRQDLDRAEQVGQIGWWRLDTRRDVLTWSDESHRIFGVPKGVPLAYETFLGLIPSDDRARVDREWAAALRGEPYDLEHRILADGRVKWVREKAFLEFDSAGELLGGFGITQDITKLKEAERHLRELNETLEQRVAERTRDVEQQADQLRALANELTQVEQRERERLARTLHDHFQQLLFSAQLQVSLIPHADPGTIELAAQSVDAVLREALATSRSLTVELFPPVLHLSGLAAALSWLARRMKEKQQLQVRVRADREAEPATREVRAFLFDAVRELLLNVAKHADAREASVTMLGTSDGCCQIVVEDPGRGFDPAAVGPGHGAGFGLFSVQQRMLHLGGTLVIESAPGQGTRVTLTIPREPSGGGDSARIAVSPA